MMPASKNKMTYKIKETHKILRWLRKLKLPQKWDNLKNKDNLHIAGKHTAMDIFSLAVFSLICLTYLSREELSNPHIYLKLTLTAIW